MGLLVISDALPSNHLFKTAIGILNLKGPALPSKKQILGLFLFVFLFRLFFGLWQANWMEVDYFQTYLIGLKFYTTGAWPYFGPDVNGLENLSFQSQIPGAMEGLLIGLPFHLLRIPEAPFILLNLMNTAGILLLAGYIHRRLPTLSFAWLSLWIASLPWTLHEGTMIINPAFTLLPGVLFFIGFMESAPFFAIGWLSTPWANALMGLSLFSVMQLHFSYVYLVPLAAFSLLSQLWKSRKLSAILHFILGALPALALIIPTYLKYGLSTNNVASGFAVPFDWDNVKAFGTILARFLSLACYEMPRFLGLTTGTREAFLTDHPLLLVPGACLWIAGYIQAVILLFGWFKRRHPDFQWRENKWLIAAILLMVEVSFWFTIKRPYSHILFVLLPFVVSYACYVWVLFAPQKHWGTLAKVLVIFSVFFHIFYAPVFEPQYSIYPQRAMVAKAIQAKDYHLMGERRPGSFY